jgi:hypothetical protein
MRGRRLQIPIHRRMALDIARQGQRVPAFPVDRRLDFRGLEELRRELTTRISWAAIYTRAFGLVSQKIPALRQSYHRFPTPGLYEHPEPVASLSVNRPARPPHEPEDHLVFCRVVAPDRQPLTAIQAAIDGMRLQPLTEVYSEGLALSRQPTPVRRLIWWLLMELWGRKKAKKLGTFSISTLAGQGAWNRQHPLVLTTSIAYAPIESDGHGWVTLLCDHRVLDGALAAQCLQLLQQELQTSLRDELQTLVQMRPTAGPIARCA